MYNKSSDNGCQLTISPLYYFSTNDEITHLLHISKKLPPLEESVETLDSTMDEAS